MEHSPLLTPGLHEIGESDLERQFIEPFKESNTRPYLILGLRNYLSSLKRLGISFEVWIDGSFSTEKIDPSDVDLVIFASEEDINSLDDVGKIHLSGLLDRLSAKSKYGCDVLFSLAEDSIARSYWRGWYGFDRNERPKGISRLVINP
ncbi:MAG: DUF6932 family protein [Polynucleobacter sp.]